MGLSLLSFFLVLQFVPPSVDTGFCNFTQSIEKGLVTALFEVRKHQGTYNLTVQVRPPPIARAHTHTHTHTRRAGRTVFHRSSFEMHSPCWAYCHTVYIPTLGKPRQADLCEFKASLVYRVSFRTVQDSKGYIVRSCPGGGGVEICPPMERSRVGQG
jgi:hypothetical protein